jgi:hypothetical protein
MFKYLVIRAVDFVGEIATIVNKITHLLISNTPLVFALEMFVFVFPENILSNESKVRVVCQRVYSVRELKRTGIVQQDIVFKRTN